MQKRQHFYVPDLTPPPETELGASFEADSFGGRHPVTKQAKLRESVLACPPDTTDAFDDTAFYFRPPERRRRLREHAGQFSRGVPTNDETSSRNYPDKNNVRIIDGEHKTLLSLGKINEAMEDDPHTEHILAHRLELADPNLSETRRNALLEHIADHSKKYQKKLKAVSETKERFKKGLGLLSRAKPATTYDVIPQDSPVDLERKRTAGNISMESKMKRFDRAVGVAYGGGRRRGL
jgi:hypothetical protein